MHPTGEEIARKLAKAAREAYFARIQKEDDDSRTLGAVFILLILVWIVAEAWNAGLLN